MITDAVKVIQPADGERVFLSALRQIIGYPLCSQSYSLHGSMEVAAVESLSEAVRRQHETGHPARTLRFVDSAVKVLK